MKKLSTALGKAGTKHQRSSSSDEQTDTSASSGDSVTINQSHLTYLSLSGCFQITDDGLR